MNFKLFILNQELQQHSDEHTCLLARLSHVHIHIEAGFVLKLTYLPGGGSLKGESGNFVWSYGGQHDTDLAYQEMCEVKVVSMTLATSATKCQWA